ncbi:MAG: hypothetical protein ABJ275_02355 [Maricaulaceae bacterium]
MGSKRRYIRRASAGIIIASALWGSLSVAADDAKNKALNNDAASSLKSILKKAGEQGFIAIEGDVQTPVTERASSETLSQKPSSKPATKITQLERNNPLGIVDCNITSVLDLSNYTSLESYDAIHTAKSALEKVENIEDVMPLAHSYMALGFGAEMSGVVKNFKGNKARLIESIGRTIEGDQSVNDYEFITRYSDCNSAALFWSQFSGLIISPDANNVTPFELSYDDEDFLNELPVNLKKIVTTRFGIYAAENGSRMMATKLLTSLVPRARRGELATYKDDGLLYFHGLVRQIDGDPSGLEIFKHLAERDGLYRVRSLQRLAEENLSHGTRLYESFSDDVDAVSQQYNGQQESRQASLQIIKHRLNTDSFIDAIKQVKREFTAVDVERVEAVIFAADRMKAAFKDELKSRQLLALNAFLYDLDFFASYDDLTTLQGMANNTAIDLNLPELVSNIFSTSKTLSSDDKDMLLYAQTLIAAKHGEYDTVIKTAKGFSGNPDFQSLKLEAAVKSGNFKETIASLKLTAEDAERYALHSGIAWQNGEWSEAKMALESLAGETPNTDLTTKIALANYIGDEGRAYVDRAVPKTAVDFDNLTAQLIKDMTVVQGYLSNG